MAKLKCSECGTEKGASTIRYQKFKDDKDYKCRSCRSKAKAEQKAAKKTEEKKPVAKKPVAKKK